MATKNETTKPPREILDELGIDAVCDMIIDGMLLREICRKLGIKGHASLIAWISSDKDRAKRVEAARRLSAIAHEEAALESIRSANGKLALAKAKEEAHHQRWRASKLNPQAYGDKLDLNHSGQTTVRVKDYTGRKREEGDV